METSQRLHEAFRKYHARKIQPQVVQRLAQVLERPPEKHPSA